mgnify:CR=1 FL=1
MNKYFDIRQDFWKAEFEKALPYEAYLAAAEAFGARPGDCWMVGNSPRSDVNPAMAAGLAAIHVPHPAPWHREIEPLHARAVVAASFADVPRIVGEARRPR